MLYNVGVYKNREKYLKRLLDVTCGMEEVVQELLLVSRLESPDFNMNQTKFDFGLFVKECLTGHEEILISHRLSVSVALADQLIIRADKILMKKVLNNLISNAENYSPDQSDIEIKALRIDSVMRFSIENTGVTIPEESMKKIFDPLFRVEQSRNRTTGGSGMGLHIVKTILELHKFSYKIENTANSVRFSIEINLE